MEEYKDYIENGLTLEEAKFIHVKLSGMEYRSKSDGDKCFVFMISEPNADVDHIQNFFIFIGGSLQKQNGQLQLQWWGWQLPLIRSYYNDR